MQINTQSVRIALINSQIRRANKLLAIQSGIFGNDFYEIAKNVLEYEGKNRYVVDQEINEMTKLMKGE